MKVDLKLSITAPFSSIETGGAYRYPTGVTICMKISALVGHIGHNSVNLASGHTFFCEGNEQVIPLPHAEVKA